jgi:hypothetical protein
MDIIPQNRSHPAWCNTRLCSAYLYENGDISYEHRSSAAPWRPAESDCSVIAWATQIDERSELGSTGRVNVTLAAVEEVSFVPGTGIAPKVDIDLSPSEARRLATQLLNVADEVELIRQSAPHRTNV